ncbi:MAG: hypothetical protein M1836_006844 [Candelina mexicana]|nr:MAG: hypothetical protein M1836_006844 [Candelina mexicana]
MFSKVAVLAFLAGFGSFAVADRLDRAICFCRGWHPHLHEWRDGFIATNWYDSPQLNKTFIWTSLCEQSVPSPSIYNSVILEDFLKSKPEGECGPHKLNTNTCADIDGHHICFQPRDGNIEIDGESYNIDLKKKRKTEIQMDCTPTCELYHGPQSSETWEDLTSACSRRKEDGKTERAFHCERQHYADLKDYQWPVGSFDDQR